MSDTESFIGEVSEELRRERLFALYRRFGWIGAALVVFIVIGAIGLEWARARSLAAEQATGDAIFAALRADSPEQSAAMLEDLSLRNDEARAMIHLKRAALLLDSGDMAGSIAVLDAVRGDSDYSETFRGLADLKALLIQGADLPMDERRARFTDLARAGAPYRLLALEQLALLTAEAGDNAGAVAELLTLLGEDGVSPVMTNRIGQTIISLGGDVPQPPAALTQ